MYDYNLIGISEINIFILVYSVAVDDVADLKTAYMGTLIER